ncbi:MAG: hypothetical protein LH628_05540 [Microcoleus sp. CAN_BIN18]|nr:hypothetical protein [Microcoleus sp. CAN_BIN18]
MIIKPQDALFCELCFKYSIFCIQKREEGRSPREVGRRKNGQGTYVERFSGIMKPEGIFSQCPTLPLCPSQVPDLEKSPDLNS